MCNKTFKKFRFIYQFLLLGIFNPDMTQLDKICSTHFDDMFTENLCKKVTGKKFLEKKPEHKNVGKKVPIF